MKSNAFLLCTQNFVEESIHFITYEVPYIQLYGIIIGYFFVLYFLGGTLFKAVCGRLHYYRVLNKIVLKTPSNKQIKFEIRKSIQSILLFGLTGLPIFFLIRNDIVRTLSDTLPNVLITLVALNLWNELYFFLIHRLMHIPYFMKKVHFVHHRSRIPTVYSVFSFHSVEATLLSMVPLILCLVLPLSPAGIFIYPFTSILLNFAGHCNYRFGTGKGNSWRIFASHHNEHHSKGRKNYGFALNYLDKFYTYIKNKI